MARLGPWGAERRVAVAVSGGGDSMALALLAAGWGKPLALIVDHGLRANAAEEAREAAARLHERGIPARILRLHGLAAGAGLAARARTARYAALAGACRAAGFVHLLIGHHAADQAETRRMREAAGSGTAGLAGMAAVTESADIRLVRPLLGLHPARLRATLRAAGLAWAEDPTNTDARFLRARLRAGMSASACIDLAAASIIAGEDRAAAEAAIAATLAERATLRPEGFAIITPGPIAPAALAALVQTIGGRAYPPPAAAIRALAAAPRPATLAGTRLMRAGKLGPGFLLAREARAMAPPMPAANGAVWDNRFRLRGNPPTGATIGALGPLGGRWPLPAALLVTLPALRLGGELLRTSAMPGHAGDPGGNLRSDPGGDPGGDPGLEFVFAPPRAAGGAAFLPAGRGRGC